MEKASKLCTHDDEKQEPTPKHSGAHGHGCTFQINKEGCRIRLGAGQIAKIKHVYEHAVVALEDAYRCGQVKLKLKRKNTHLSVVTLPIREATTLIN